MSSSQKTRKRSADSTAARYGFTAKLSLILHFFIFVFFLNKLQVFKLQIARVVFELRVQFLNKQDTLRKENEASYSRIENYLRSRAVSFFLTRRRYLTLYKCMREGCKSGHSRQQEIRKDRQAGSLWKDTRIRRMGNDNFP